MADKPSNFFTKNATTLMVIVIGCLYMGDSLPVGVLHQRGMSLFFSTLLDLSFYYSDIASRKQFRGHEPFAPDTIKSFELTPVPPLLSREGD
jgi:hypothetical protein